MRFLRSFTSRSQDTSHTDRLVTGQTLVTRLLYFAAAPSCPSAASPPQLSCQRLSNMQLISTYRNDERSFKTALRMTRRTVGRRTEGRSSAGMCVTPAVLPGRRRRLDYYYESTRSFLESLERRSKFPSSTLNELPQNSACIFNDSFKYSYVRLFIQHDHSGSAAILPRLATPLTLT